MRIISGKWKGKSITSPSEGTRPSTDRTRQALFSMLQHLIEKASVLDLCAGSGSLSLECLSRGAGCAIAVESDRKSCQIIKKNANNLKSTSLEVYQGKAISFLDRAPKRKFDLIFADPPYEDDFENSLLLEILLHPSWRSLAHSETYFIAESPGDLPSTGFLPSNWKPITERSYGKCHITILQFQQEA